MKDFTMRTSAGCRCRRVTRLSGSWSTETGEPGRYDLLCTTLIAYLVRSSQYEIKDFLSVMIYYVFPLPVTLIKPSHESLTLTNEVETAGSRPSEMSVLWAQWCRRGSKQNLSEAYLLWSKRGADSFSKSVPDVNISPRRAVSQIWCWRCNLA